MSNQEITNIILVVGFLIITFCIIFVTYFLIKALKSITDLADSLQNTTQIFREKIQMNILRLIPAVLVGLIGRFFKKRG